MKLAQLFKKKTHFKDEDFEKMYQEEINRFPPVFHIVGEKRETGFKSYIIFNAVYALVCIFCLYKDLPLMFSKLGIIIAASILLMILFDKENVFGIVALITFSSLLLVAKAPLYLMIFFFLGMVWAAIAFGMQHIAFKKAQNRSAELYKLELEHTIREHRKATNPMAYVDDYELPEIKYCPLCGFSIPEGEETCYHCNPDNAPDKEPPKPAIGKFAAPVTWPVSSSGPGLKKDDASSSGSSDADDVVI